MSAFLKRTGILPKEFLILTIVIQNGFDKAERTNLMTKSH